MSAQLFDNEILSMLKEALGDDLDNIIQLYLDTAPGNLHEIDQAINNGDAQALARAAHKFKGASANVGAIAVSQLALQLESMGKNQQLSDIAPVHQQLLHTFDQTQQAFIQNNY